MDGGFGPFPGDARTISSICIGTVSYTHLDVYKRQAALRSGAGLVDVATRELHVPVVLARRPEVMAHGIESGEDLEPLLSRAGAIGIGPGLGQGEWGKAMLRLALASQNPLVLDADALNFLAAAPRVLTDAILTPHPGEAARLLGIDTAAVQADRFAAAAAIAVRYEAVTVLKLSLIHI